MPDSRQRRLLPRARSSKEGADAEAEVAEAEVAAPHIRSMLRATRRRLGAASKFSA
jgi:hypothetical protein